MSAVADEVQTLKTLIKALRQISRYVSVEFLRKGIRLVSIDENDLCCCRLTMHSAYFKRYNCRERMRLIIDIDPLIRLLDAIGSSKHLRIKPHSTSVRFSYRDGDWTGSLVTGEENESKVIKAPRKILPKPIAVAHMPVDVLTNIIRNVASLADELIWEIRKQNLSVSAQQLSHSYVLKSTTRNRLHFSSRATLRMGVPTHFLKMVPIVPSLTEDVTVRFFRDGLALFLLGEPKKFTMEFLISCRLIE